MLRPYVIKKGEIVMRFSNGVEFDNSAYAMIDGPNKTLYLNMNNIHLAKDGLTGANIEKVVIPKETVVTVESMIEEIEALTSEAPQKREYAPFEVSEDDYNLIIKPAMHPKSNSLLVVSSKRLSYIEDILKSKGIDIAHTVVINPKKDIYRIMGHRFYGVLYL